MKLLLVFIFIFFQSTLFADTHSQLERINFYPDADAYASIGYRFQTLEITTPQASVNTKRVKNYQNIFSAVYAYNFKRFYLGVKSAYELATESAVISGIPSDDKYASQGFKNLELFILSRIRKQNEDDGNIDLFVSFADEMGKKEVGKSSSNRQNGRNIFDFGISHGYLEDKWEFKNSLNWMFFDEGEEHNDFSQETYQLRAYNIFSYFFSGQYQYDEWMFLNAAIGIRYRTVQKISDGTTDKKEIQAGTGSVFRLGMKKPFGPYSLLDLRYEYERYSYFVKGVENFDGEATAHSVELSLIQSF